LGTSDELKYVHDAEIQISLAVFWVSVNELSSPFLD
jgi:hypothetical protein